MLDFPRGYGMLPVHVHMLIMVSPGCAAAYGMYLAYAESTQRPTATVEEASTSETWVNDRPHGMTKTHGWI